MFGNGQKQEVIIQVLPRYEETPMSVFGGGVTTVFEYDRLRVWCDHGFKSKFEKIPGIFLVQEEPNEPHYCAYVDPRFDTRFIIAEIEAAVKTGKPRKVGQDPEPFASFSIFNGMVEEALRNMEKADSKPTKKPRSNKRRSVKLSNDNKHKRNEEE